MHLVSRFDVTSLRREVLPIRGTLCAASIILRSVALIVCILVHGMTGPGDLL